jgi:hypothetical protein
MRTTRLVEGIGRDGRARTDAVVSLGTSGFETETTGMLDESEVLMMIDAGVRLWLMSIAWSKRSSSVTESRSATLASRAPTES